MSNFIVQKVQFDLMVEVYSFGSDVNYIYLVCCVDDEVVIICKIYDFSVSTKRKKKKNVDFQFTCVVLIEFNKGVCKERNCIFFYFWRFKSKVFVELVFDGVWFCVLKVVFFFDCDFIGQEKLNSIFR